MLWPFRSPRTRAADVDSEPVWSEPVVRHSPGLQAALAMVRVEHPWRVLDLGPGIGTNVEFLSGRARHVRFVGLLEGDSPWARPADAEQNDVTGEAERFLPASWGEFDLVLAWDVLDYLDGARARSVVDRLHVLCRPGACLFALAAIAGDLPERPLVYSIVGDDTLEYRTLTPARRPGPSRPSLAIERVLAGFSIERSFVLRHGVQEYVATRD